MPDTKAITALKDKLIDVWVAMGGITKRQEQNLPITKDQAANLKILRKDAYDLEQQIIALGGQPYLTPDQIKQLDDLKGKQQDITTAIYETEQAHIRETNMIQLDMIKQQLAISGLSMEDQIKILGEVELKWGLIDDATKQEWDRVGAVIHQIYVTGSATDELLAKLMNLPKDVVINVTTRYNEEGQPAGYTDPRTGSGYGGRAGGGWGYGGRAGGGWAYAGQPYLVGERGPEVFRPASSGAIETHHHWNLTVNTSSPITPIIQDYNMMKSLAGGGS